MNLILRSCSTSSGSAPNNLDQCLSRIEVYEKAGCDYAVVFALYLIKQSQEGALEFYLRLADRSKPKPERHSST